MIKEYTKEELKETFPQSYRNRDKYGTYRYKDPTERDPSSWTESDRNYVRMVMAEKAERILNEAKAKNKVDEVQRMLIEELNKQAPRPSYVPYESESIFDDDVPMTTNPTNTLFR